MRTLRQLTTFVFAVSALLYMLVASAQAAEPDMSVVEDAARKLEGSRVAEPPTELRGPGADLYNATVPVVPVVISGSGTGSGVVIASEPPQAFVITNAHVVKTPLSKKSDGPPIVALLFYDDALKNEIFSYQRFVGCIQTPDSSAWCRAAQRAFRWAAVVALDENRDLALLQVANAPSGLPAALLAAEQPMPEPMDQVFILGHPASLLWTFTIGRVTKIGLDYPLGKGFGTVIQTDAAINPGNSGGPAFVNGKVAGIVFSAWAIPLKDGTMPIPGQGLNFVIGIKEVRAFIGSITK